MKHVNLFVHGHPVHSPPRRKPCAPIPPQYSVTLFGSYFSCTTDAATVGEGTLSPAATPAPTSPPPPVAPTPNPTIAPTIEQTDEESELQESGAPVRAGGGGYFVARMAALFYALVSLASRTARAL